MDRIGQGSWKPGDSLPDPFGRLARPEPEPVSRFAISWDRDDVSVAKPVGPRGANRPGDVGRIEQMLGTTGHLDLDATDGPTGFFGRRLEGAIKNYQKDRGLKVDGVIKPGGETIRSLSGLFGQPPGIASGNRQNEWDRFWDSRTAPKVGAEPEDGAPRQRNLLLTPQDRAKDPRKSMMPMLHRPGYVWEDGDWRLETPEERRRPKIMPLVAGEQAGGMHLSGRLPSRQELMDLMDAGNDSGDANGKPPGELEKAVGETLLSLVPGVGEAMSAKDAYDAGKAALAAWEQGDLADASKKAGLAALSALGAIPVAGTVARAGKGAVKIGKPLLKKFRKQFADDKDFERFARRIEDRTPLGFASREDVAKVVGAMQDKLKKSGFDDVTVAMWGSSVTGRRFSDKTGKYDGPGFDRGRESDLDFALVSPKLFEALKQRGVPLKGKGTRTGIIGEKFLKDLELEDLLPPRFGGKDRDRSIVVFGDNRSLSDRGPYMTLDR